MENKRNTQKFDATGQSVGRLATKVAIALRGKDRPDFQPHLDKGDIVEVKNVARLKFTGKKLEQKKYYHYSGYPGGMKEKKMGEVFENDPAEVLRRAVRKMLPDTRLRKNMLRRLIIKK